VKPLALSSESSDPSTWGTGVKRAIHNGVSFDLSDPVLGLPGSHHLCIKSWLSVPNGSKVIKGQASHWFGLVLSFEWETKVVNQNDIFPLQAPSVFPIEDRVCDVSDLEPQFVPPISYPIFSIFSRIEVPLKVFQFPPKFPLNLLPVSHNKR